MKGSPVEVLIAEDEEQIQKEFNLMFLHFCWFLEMPLIKKPRKTGL